MTSSKLIRGTTVLSFALALAACGADTAQPPPDRQTADLEGGGVVPPAPAGDPDAGSSRIIAAAEPFEALTESAFSADHAKLNDLIATAKSSARAVATDLSPAARSLLASRLEEIDGARRDGRSADMAIASVEGYRTLIESASAAGPVPPQVSLLDYAGFRYQADLNATPARWRDATEAVAFARRQWSALGPQVRDEVIRARMSDAITELGLAADSSDAARAADAAVRQLDLVDELEVYFAKP